jgi:hypothetical protein
MISYTPCVCFIIEYCRWYMEVSYLLLPPTAKAFHNWGFLARYHRQNAYVAPYLMRKESGVVS